VLEFDLGNKSPFHGKFNSSSPIQPRSSSAETTRNKKQRILYWTQYFGTKDYEFKPGDIVFKDAGCRVTNCLLTDDRSLLNTSDAVIFHINDFDDRDMPDPLHRRPNQRFIFHNYETMVGFDDYPMFTQTKHFFNWTMTYRRDSDIYDVRTYGAIQRRTNALPPPTSMPVRLGPEVLPPDPASMMMTNHNKSISSRHFLLAKKTKMVAWFASHCRTDSLREKYFQLVGQHVPIDTYGSCGSLKCVPLRSEKCDKLLDSYKFYVAAENAICPDYVTEKFYRAMAADIVPIVYGGADYSAYAPPMSYINAGDFKSPKALADYLKLLDENDGLYLKFFDWKKDYEVVRKPVSGWCELCEKLNDPQQKQKVYADMTDWWYHKDIACLSGYDYLDHLLQQLNAN
jgi:alpha-1,3-fucosyltransferase